MEINLKLTEQEYKLLLIALQELPYKNSAPLINKIVLKVQEQLNVKTKSE